MGEVQRHPMDLVGLPPLKQNPLEPILDAILATPSRELQLRFLQMVLDDVASKVKSKAHLLVQDAMQRIMELPTPPLS